MAPEKKDPKLNEVRAVLQGLQGLTTDGEPSGQKPATDDPRPARRASAVVGAIVLATAAGIFGTAYFFAGLNQPATTTPAPKPLGTAEAPAPAKPPVSRAMSQSDAPSTTASQPSPEAAAVRDGKAQVAPPAYPPQVVAPPERAAAPRVSAAKPALEAALDLMTKGRVRAARERLLALAGGGAPQADVAWALARSYDPNYLVAIPSADVPPDIKEATRWYRAWYAAAVRQGLVADSVSLERIIGSMSQ
jgi:hypothetical protein